MQVGKRWTGREALRRYAVAPRQDLLSVGKRLEVPCLSCVNRSRSGKRQFDLMSSSPMEEMRRKSLRDPAREIPWRRAVQIRRDSLTSGCVKLNELGSNAICAEGGVGSIVRSSDSIMRVLPTRDGISMKARVVAERAMVDDSRVVKLEAGVQHLQSDVTEIKSEVKLLRDVVDLLKRQFLSFKAEVATEFGSVKTSIERAKLWMLVTGVGIILSVWGAALALARFLKP